MRGWGFAFEFHCFSLREWDNWQFSRQSQTQMASFGPLRVWLRRTYTT